MGPYMAKQSKMEPKEVKGANRGQMVLNLAKQGKLRPDRAKMGYKKLNGALSLIPDSLSLICHPILYHLFRLSYP